MRQTETMARTGGTGSIVLDNLPAELASSRNDAAHRDIDENGSDQNGSVGNFSAGQHSVDTTRIGKYRRPFFFSSSLARAAQHTRHSYKRLIESHTMLVLFRSRSQRVV